MRTMTWTRVTLALAASIFLYGCPDDGGGDDTTSSPTPTEVPQTDYPITEPPDTDTPPSGTDTPTDTDIPGTDTPPVGTDTPPAGTDTPPAGTDTPATDTKTPPPDDDGDGFPAGDDCDDGDGTVHPGAEEVPNDGVDQDCDGDDLTDGDADGYTTDDADPDLRDCDDEDPSIHPKALEVPYDDVDQDCDGEDLTDVDGDGHDSTAAGGDDCNDDDVNSYPGAAEYADGQDNDCDGKADEGLDVTDDDGDGYSEAAGDCNDDLAGTYPGATDVPYNGIDEDCSGQDLTDVDQDGFDGGPDGSDPDDCDDSDSTVYPDATEVAYDKIDQDCDGADLIDVDGDGYPGAEAGAPGPVDCDDDDASIHPGASEVPYDGVDQDCSSADLTDVDVDGYAATAASGTDCNDKDASIHPGASEVCDSVDNNCDDVTDTDAVDRKTWYADTDNDSYGDPSKSTLACSRPSGYVADGTDCDDSNAAVSPAGTESCNAVDDDCDGTVDDGVKSTFWRDADGDGFGDPASTTQACSAPSGYVNNKTDCDDTAASTYPGATESCNGTDDDCDASIDEDVKSTFWQDTDGDGYGNVASSTQACSAPSGYVSDKTDCDDAVASTYPGAAESCNGVDDDCDTTVDEGVKTTYYRDADGDGYGTSATTTQACTAPSGYVSSSTDCNDGAASVYPNATESCNGVDDDCDSTIDEGVKTTYYRDADGDGFGTSSTTTQACTAPTGYVSNSGDCDDADSSLHASCTSFGNGSSGTQTLSGTFNLNTQASSGRSQPDGVAWKVTAAIGGTTITLENTAGLAIGDKVLLASLQGAGSGAWEVLEIASVASGSIVVTSAPTRSYNSADLIIVQRIPQYQDLTVTGTLTASAWDSLSTTPRKTGVVAVMVKGTFTHNGSITTAKLGYKGGCSSGPFGSKGEVKSGGGTGSNGGWADGGAGAGTPSTVTGGKGANSCSNAGGAAGLGGGGGGGKITHCAGGSPVTGGGGGGGGAAYNAVANESSTDLMSLLHGGGASAGAQGASSGANAGSGTQVAPGGGPVGSTCAEAGGGSILIFAKKATVVGTFTATGGNASNGGDGESTNGGGSDDGGGGGASGGNGGSGGSIRLYYVDCALATNTVLARGGSGGNGGRGGGGYASSGGVGGTGAAFGGNPTNGANGVYAGDGGAPGGGGAGGFAGKAGVIAVYASTVNTFAVSSSDGQTALKNATGNGLSYYAAITP